MLVWKCHGTVWVGESCSSLMRKPGTFGVAGAALDLVEVAGVLDGLKSCRGCHEKSLDAVAALQQGQADGALIDGSPC